MTVKELANAIATEFNKAVKEAGCTTFKEMKSLYDWDAQDVRSEIEYMVNGMAWGEDECGEDIYSGCAFFGNNIANVRDVHDEDSDITYGQFKKMVFANVQ